VKEGVLSRRGRYQKIHENLHAKEVIVGDGVRRRRYILCYNPREAERARSHREQVLKDLEEKLASHSDPRALAQWAVELKASGRYGRYLRTTKGGKLKIDWRAVREAARCDGKWVVQTNDDTMTVEDAACGYKALMVIERCFHALKRTRIKMTPMHHWLPRRIEAHVKICVLALLIERAAERMCGQPWTRIRETLGALQATEYETESFHFFQRNKLHPSVLSTLKSLGIKPPERVLEISPRS